MSEREFRRKSNNAAPFFFITMAAPVQQANAPPPTADVDEVIQMLIKDGKRRKKIRPSRDADDSISREEEKTSDRFLNLDLFFPLPRKKKNSGTFDKLRRRLLEELASDAEVSARADEAVAAEMERRARVGSAGGERPGSASGALGNGGVGSNSSAAAVTAASFLAAPGARKEVVSRAAADAEDAVTAAALAAAWRILYKDKGGGSEAAAGEAQQEQQQQGDEAQQPQPLPAPSPSLASEVELATERALRRLWDERDGVAAEGGGGG